jgi:glycosyltransferase involved in cell wall biosynthesis
MNLPFAAWVASRLHRIAPVWVMFHEVAFPLRKWPVPHVLLGVMTRVMARLIAHASDRVFVSIPVWGTLLSAIAPRSKPAEWLPVPCSVEAASDSATIAAVRDRFAPPRGGLVGHFGTFGKLIGDLLESATVALLRLVPEAAMLFIGRGSDSFRDRFATAHSEFATRVHASGRLAASAISAHLLACDLVIQPYPDGISTRRTSAMAALANGVATVTNLGPLSERLWPADAVIAAPTPDPIAIAHLAAELLADPARRSTLSRSAASLYQRGFALGKTISRLRDNVL